MLSEPKAIFFQTELRMPPIDDLALDKKTVRQLYQEMASPGGYLYENLEMQADPPVLSTTRQNGKSVCSVGRHEVCIEEQQPELTINEFISTVQTVVAGLVKVCESDPPVFMQETKIRCLVRPNGKQNSVELLAGSLANVFEKVDPFGRPPAFFGVRFRFPPVHFYEKDDEEDGEDEEEADEHLDAADREGDDYERSLTKSTVEEGEYPEDEGPQDFVTLRYETWAKDHKMVWMEIISSSIFKETIDLSEFGKIGKNIQAAYDFLTDKGVRFLNQFDDGPPKPP